MPRNRNLTAQINDKFACVEIQCNTRNAFKEDMVLTASKGSCAKWIIQIPRMALATN